MIIDAAPRRRYGPLVTTSLAGASSPVTDQGDHLTPRAPRPRTAYDVWRWCLLLGNALLLVVAVLLGARPAPWSAVDQGVREGSITSVTVSGATGPGTSDVQEVTWRDGLVQRRAEVLVRPPGTEGTSSLPVVSQDAGRALQVLAPGLDVRHDGRSTDSGVGFWGFQLPWPDVLGISLLLGWACWLGVLVHGPAPWRATRWGWFWVSWVSWVPGGVVAFLLLAGPTPLLPAPRRVQRRLTGGWALLLSVFLAPVVGGLVGLPF